MSRGVSCWLFGSVAVVALLALAGCGHYFFAEREPWRHDAEVACLNSGAVRDTPGRVRVSAIEGPGMCGADFPIRVSELGDSAPLGYDDEPVRPPGSIPDGATPPRWPGAQPPPSAALRAAAAGALCVALAVSGAGHSRRAVGAALVVDAGGTAARAAAVISSPPRRARPRACRRTCRIRTRRA